MEPEHQGQTWEFPSLISAKVLSAKTRKMCGPAHTLESIDNIENYDCEIDFLEPEHQESLRDFSGHKDLLTSRAETETRPLSWFGNQAEDSYQQLRFFVWYKQMDDGIDGAHPLKPDLAGIFASTGTPDMIFWSRPGEEEEMIVPVEVNSNWRELVLQAGTYARCLFSASPLRQFTVVLDCEHMERRLQFLTYHRGGLNMSEIEAASHDLNPFASEGQKDILRLFLSLLMWKSPADAGFPLWCNETSICIPMQIDDHFVAEIDSVLHNNTCIRGRSTRVLGVKKRNTVLLSSDSYPVELGSLEPVTQATLHRSSRQPENPILPSKSDTAPQKSSLESLGSGVEPTMDCRKPISISRSLAARTPPVFVKQVVDWVPENPSLKNSSPDTFALKFSWALSRDPNSGIVEPDLLRECGGMFGVPKHLCSFRAHHKDACPTTNHLFLPTPENVDTHYWDVFSIVHFPPVYHSLLGHVIAPVGNSLVSAPDVPSLVRAIVHAHLCYYNMYQKNFQHRDISIGNVLMVDHPLECEPFTIKQPNSTQMEILDICKRLGIKNECHGFVIDGDMAINWDTYFEKKHDGLNSGTPEFMSRALLRSHIATVIHSPIDDYWSFYFTAQWAGVFHQVLPGETKGDPVVLQDLCSSLAGNIRDRDSGTISILDERLRNDSHGSFLTEMQPFLKDWNQAMNELL